MNAGATSSALGMRHSFGPLSLPGAAALEWRSSTRRLPACMCAEQHCTSLSLA